MAKNYYELLGLHYEAEDIVVRAAYKALAQKYHPDKSASNAEQATVIMTQFSEAFQVLNDPKLRKRYDEVLNRRPFSEPQPKSRSKSQDASTARPSSPQAHASEHRSTDSQTKADHEQNATQPNFSSKQSQRSQEREKPFDFESDANGEHDAQFAVKLTHKLIEKIQANQIDEGHIVSLFEKLFQQSLTIHHGMLNSYTFVHSGKKYTHNFSSLKTAILRRLQEACV